MYFFIYFSSLKSMIYPNFFSFLRDTMKRSNNHFMTFAELEFHTEKWEQEPVSALNVWFTLMLSWSKVISSMLKFLIGELPSMPIKDPIVEQNEETKAWRWIGRNHTSFSKTILLHLFINFVLFFKVVMYYNLHYFIISKET